MYGQKVLKKATKMRCYRPCQPKTRKRKTEQPKSEIIEGLIHISEIDWQLIEDPREFLKVGQTVQAKIIGIEGDRLSFRLKALKKDPGLRLMKNIKKANR